MSNSIANWAKDLNTHFTKEDVQMTCKYVKICLTSCALRVLKLRKYHYIPIRMIQI